MTIWQGKLSSNCIPYSCPSLHRVCTEPPESTMALCGAPLYLSLVQWFASSPSQGHPFLFEVSHFPPESALQTRQKSPELSITAITHPVSDEHKCMQMPFVTQSDWKAFGMKNALGWDPLHLCPNLCQICQWVKACHLRVLSGVHHKYLCHEIVVCINIFQQFSTSVSNVDVPPVLELSLGVHASAGPSSPLSKFVLPLRHVAPQLQNRVKTGGKQHQHQQCCPTEW